MEKSRTTESNRISNKTRNEKCMRAVDEWNQAMRGVGSTILIWMRRVSFVCICIGEWFWAMLSITIVMLIAWRFTVHMDLSVDCGAGDRHIVFAWGLSAPVLPKRCLNAGRKCAVGCVRMASWEVCGARYYMFMHGMTSIRMWLAKFDYRKKIDPSKNGGSRATARTLSLKNKASSPPGMVIKWPKKVVGYQSRINDRMAEVRCWQRPFKKKNLHRQM